MNKYIILILLIFPIAVSAANLIKIKKKINCLSVPSIFKIDFKAVFNKKNLLQKRNLYLLLQQSPELRPFQKFINSYRLEVENKFEGNYSFEGRDSSRGLSDHLIAYRSQGIYDGPAELRMHLYYPKQGVYDDDIQRVWDTIIAWFNQKNTPTVIEEETGHGGVDLTSSTYFNLNLNPLIGEIEIETNLVRPDYGPLHFSYVIKGPKEQLFRLHYIFMMVLSEQNMLRDETKERLHSFTIDAAEFSAMFPGMNKMISTTPSQLEN